MGMWKYWLLILLAGCGKQPPSNTEAYNNLHGVYNDGKTVNVVTLHTPLGQRGPQLRFLPSQHINVFTSGGAAAEPEIKKGQASSIETTLSIEVASANNRISERLVRIGFYTGYPPGSRNEQAEMQKYMTGAMFDRDELSWGLKRFTITRFGSLQTYLYISAHDGARFPDGRPVLIDYAPAGSRESGKAPGSCSANLIVEGRLFVGYRFDAKLLPRWKEVADRVYTLASSVLVR